MDKRSVAAQQARSVNPAVVLVTGAGSGIGRGISLRFAAEGMRVVATDLDSVRAEETVAEITRQGGQALALAVDIRERADCERALAVARDRYGRVDVLVNSAGVSALGEYLTLDDMAWERVLSTNLRGAHLIMQTVTRHWVASGQPGTVIHIGSIDAEVAYPHNVAYCVAKAGLRMLVRAVAVALAPYGITVNEIAPGLIATEMIARRMEDPDWMAGVPDRVPLGRLGRVEDVAAVAVFLASPAARFITGASIVVDGAQSLGAHATLSRQQLAGRGNRRRTAATALHSNSRGRRRS